jgi:ABC-type sugar transport system ATPase subunit
VKDNLSLASLNKISKCGIINKEVQRSQILQTIKNLQIAVSDPDQRISTLSGGNQQKLSLENG